ncbi:hypothetical protein TSTA_092330 [Talaromyces stipitatus ATCC 10500]|uniref:Uncharacterized protein n=1 Tax=Talaromyces stipitatus (strain ATCC 10500 / CBS 375.48 / QM 6759 / NRRL 1006) TaxID=441959 RepID=B8M315_TALSN|nr:uncharacterized protein TSTA_092330 [Talaromyces stipitatus ATCC 10500]EED21991.1 hypothetical protein TSTA_092330 [Talaromyces stipitatus ATCC 10500]
MTTLIRFSLVFLTLFGTIQAEQMLAFAPVTALARWDGLAPRQLFGDCPASTQTLCPDKLGCCPKGVACTYSRSIPVCEESCKGGPTCPQGGCCQVGYICGTTNNFCTPAPTAPPKKVDNKEEAVEAPVTSAPSTTPTGATEDADEHEETTSRPSTPTVRASSSHHVVSATKTATATTARDGSKYVGVPSGSNTKSPSQSAQATNSGASSHASSLSIGN